MGTRNPNDVRNSLVLDFFRFVKAIRPAFFVMENVPGILTDPFRAVLDQGLDSLGSRYIFVGPLLVDASGYGAATRRIRVVVVGYQPEYVDSISNDDFKVPSLLNEPTVFDAIHDLQGPENAVAMDDGHYYAPYGLAPVRGKKGEYARRARQFPPVGLASEKIRKDRRTGRVFGFNPTKHSNEVIKRFSELEVGTSDSVSKCPRLAWDRPSPTLRAGTGSERGSYQSIRPIHPNQDRVITIREAARIQGFPDWFQFHHTKWHSFRMIGNSISPLVAEKILKLLKTRTSD